MQLRTLLHNNTGCVFIIIHRETSTFLNPTAPELECDRNSSPVFSVPSFKWVYIQVLKHSRMFISLNENRIEVTELRHSLQLWQYFEIHGFVTSRLIIATLHMWIWTSCLSSYLQLVQNESVHLLDGKRRRDLIIPVLHSVLGVPVHCRLDFNMLLLVCKASNGLAVSCLSELLHVSASVRALRFEQPAALRWVRTRDNGGLAVAVSNLWNSFPSKISFTREHFKSLSKTNLFPPSLGFEIRMFFIPTDIYYCFYCYFRRFHCSSVLQLSS